MMLQIWNSQQQSYGRHEDCFNGYDIFFDFAPTPMWTRMDFAQTALGTGVRGIPDGGYRFALRVFTYPAAQKQRVYGSVRLSRARRLAADSAGFVGTPLASEAEGEVLPLGRSSGTVFG
ncbi:MAG: hypothetical protein U0694_07330 [Anaerolineae bacterium]